MAIRPAGHGEHLAIDEFAAELRCPFHRKVLVFSEFRNWTP
jgi:hypothetical protein